MAPVAVTSSTARLAKLDSPIATPRLFAARATGSSPCGCTACTPVGEITTGTARSCPMKVVARSRTAARSATCGAKPSSANAATLSSIVAPRSVPAMSAW